MVNNFIRVKSFKLSILLTGMLWVSVYSLSYTSTATAAIQSLSDLDYDIVYVRYPRRGDLSDVELPDGESPYSIEPGADLMLLRPNGEEEILVDCRAEGQEDIEGGQANCSVQDPIISYDGKWVYYSKYGNMGKIPLDQLSTAWRTSTAHSFIYKMRLDVPQSERVEIQLTNLGAGFATDKLAGNTANDEINDFSIRDLGTTLLPDGRILFTSNRDAVVSFKQGGKGSLDAVTASTSSQIYVMDDHDGSTLNKNLRLVGHSNLHQVQHPFILSDGRVVFTNWDDAGLRVGYGSSTLYIDQPDGGKMHQFLEPHRATKRVDHFATQVSSGDVIVATYYPAMSTFGFGTLLRTPVDIEGPDFSAAINRSFEDEWRFFSRIGTDELTEHSNGLHQPSPNNSGRYSTPSAGPDDSLFVAYSTGPVVRNPPCAGCVDTPAPDSGIYLIQQAGSTSITDPASQLVMLKNDPDYNEMWPRPVIPYQRIHGIERPPVIIPEEEYAPTERYRGLVAGTPFAMTGTSSMQKRESAPLGNDRFNNVHGKDGGRDTGWVVQGADSGVVTNDDLWGVRILVTTPDRYHRPWNTSQVESDNGLILDGRMRVHIKGYYTHTAENWKILGEFPVRNPDGLADISGEEDTSWLAKIPANTPHIIQSIDRFGRTLSSEQTWRHVKPGDTFASCGGCHAHSVEGEKFTGKWADSESYTPWDLVSSTPALDVNDEGNTLSVTRPVTGLWSVEFRRDIYPVLESKCSACHSSEGNLPPANNAILALFDNTLSGYEREARAYSALAKDSTQQYAHGVSIPANPAKYIFPQMSRYIRALQSRESFLAWKIYQQRLDGRSNDDRPGANGSARDEDLDYTPGQNENCPAASQLTRSEKLLITRWIDLGAPIDLDRPRMRYTDDTLSPVMTLAVQEVTNERVGLRIGALDIESGIDMDNSYAEVTPDGGSTVTIPLSATNFDMTTGVGHYVLNMTTAQITPSTPLHLYAVVQDNAGNKQMMTRTIENIRPVAGNLQFAIASKTVAENIGSVQLQVFRSEGDEGAVSINVAVTGEGNAIDGEDYNLTPMTLTWSHGEVAGQTVSLAIIDDDVAENNKTLTIALSNPTNGAALGEPSKITITIIDDEAMPQSNNDNDGSGGGSSLSIILILSLFSLLVIRFREFLKLIR